MNVRSSRAINVKFFYWSGSWRNLGTIRCDTCWNFYLGPLGIEISHDDSDDAFGCQ